MRPKTWGGAHLRQIIAGLSTGWELVAQGEWKERLILSEDYQIISHQRIE